MGPALKELGLDVKNLPPLNKIPPDKVRKVMGTFTKSLGMKCTGCHDADDFKKFWDKDSETLAAVIKKIGKIETK